jgi:hypothetical protein
MHAPPKTTCTRTHARKGARLSARQPQLAAEQQRLEVVGEVRALLLLGGFEGVLRGIFWAVLGCLGPRACVRVEEAGSAPCSCSGGGKLAGRGAGALPRSDWEAAGARGCRGDPRRTRPCIWGIRGGMLGAAPEAVRLRRGKARSSTQTNHAFSIRSENCCGSHRPAATKLDYHPLPLTTNPRAESPNPNPRS